MANVDSVNGPLDVHTLGITLMHEHVFVLTPDIMQNYGSDWWDEEERIADARQQLLALKAAGVDTIVDPTVVGLGRYIPRVQQVNEGIDINIIVATGLYTFDAIPQYFFYRGPGALFGGPEPMTELFLRDITEGIGDTGVKAGLLKGVIEEHGLTDDLRRIHTAIAETHVQTGVPITVHTNSGKQTGRLALEFYRDHGVDLTKVVIGHAGDSNDLDYLRWIGDQGAIIGCDRFGLDVFNPNDNRVDTVVKLCAEGYADRIVLSHDAACYMDYFSGPESQALLKTTLPNWNFQHISQHVLPALREQGVTDDQITAMLVDNPRRYFTGVGAVVA